MSSLAIIVPALNEGDSLFNLVEKVTRLRKLGDLNLDISLVLVDDGSSDNTWDVVSETAVAYSSLITIIGLRLPQNYGKSFAQFVGLHHSLDADLIAFMDADLQHDPDYLRHMVHLVNLSNRPVIASRKYYYRPLRNRFGSAILRCCSALLGVPFNADDCEYLVLPSNDAKKLVPRLTRGVSPLLPAVYSLGPYERIDIEIHDRVDLSKGETRWNLVALVQKFIFSILSDPWIVFPRIAAITAIMGSLSLVYAILIGVYSVWSGTFSGLASLIVILCCGLILLSALLVAIFGTIVMSFQSLSFSNVLSHIEYLHHGNSSD